MEGNICGVNHLDSDVLLPPRKRLLAGLRKQGVDSDGTFHLPLVTSSSSPPSSPMYTSNSIEYNIRLNNMLSSYLNANRSPEEIMEASRSAAVAAVKAAEIARAAAEKKAAIAAKAVAAAKSAMDLVASISEEAAGKEINLRKNKMKKHVPVQFLYTKYQPVENCRKDEELARKLHRAINSSPRILKNSSSPDGKGKRQKKLKSCPGSDKACGSNCGTSQEINPSPTRNGHANNSEVSSECSSQEVYMPKTDEKNGQSAIDNGEGEGEGEAQAEAETTQKEKICDDTIAVTSKKRGRVKLKKLPLSICSSRDQATNLKDEVKNGIPPALTLEKTGSSKSETVILGSVDSHNSPTTEGEMAIDSSTSMSIWKCQEFNAPPSVKQNKVMQS